MSSRWTRVMAVSLLGLWASWGCQTLPVLGPQETEPAKEAPPVVAEQNELPPEESAKVLLTTARSMEKAGADQQAILMYEKARYQNPQYQFVCRRLAVLYDRVGLFPRALEEYQKALALTPKDPDLLNDYGYSLYNQGKLKEAEEALRKALELAPKNQRVVVNLGLVLGAQERYEESWQMFCQVMPPAQAHSNLAFVLTGLGRREEAKREYRKALQLDPSLTLAAAALDKLEKGRNTPAASSSPPVPNKMATLGSPLKPDAGGSLPGPRSAAPQGPTDLNTLPPASLPSSLQPAQTGKTD